MTDTAAVERLSGPQLAQQLLRPASIALVGASDDPGKTAGRPLKFLRAAGYAGRLYPVNARRDTVLGERAWPSLSALPEVPEQVFVLSPTGSVLDTVREAIRLGVGVVTILASGFGDAGPQGAALEAELGALARASRTRVLGPSSLGVICADSKLVLTANAAFAESDLPAGRTFVASQSGSMIGALVSRGKARGVGFAGLVSVGGEVDLCIGEILLGTLDDPAIDSYLLFLESMQHGRQLRRFAIEAARRGRPVIAYKLGRSAAAAEMAATHTGALAGEDDVADAFLRDCGIGRVDTYESLLECLPLARCFDVNRPSSQPRRVGVVTTTGGGAAMVVDQLGVRGVTVEPASPDTLDRLTQAGINAHPGRVIDLTLAGTKYEVMKATLQIMLSAPEFDLVIAVVGSSARFNPDLAVKPIIDCAGGARPLAAMLVPEAPQAMAALTAAGVPCYRTPEACADSVAAVFGRRAPPRDLPAALLVEPAIAEHAASTAGVPVGATAGGARLLSEADAYAVLDAVGVPHAPFITLPIDTPRAALPALPFAYPVALKVCSAAVPHKTEVGGVMLGLADQAALAAALRALRAQLAAFPAAAGADLALVQPMRRGLGEVLVGYRVDAQVGPIVLLAAGGIWAEVVADRAIRLAPVDLAGARAMIGEVRMLRTLTGLRGRPRGDLDALAAAIVALSQLALSPGLGVLEAEVNPMLVMPAGQGVLAIDALVSLQEKTA